MKQIFIAVVAAAISLGVTGGAEQVQAGHGKAKIDTKIIKAGNGPKTVRHSKVTVNYTGWLENGTQFDSSFDRGEPFNFTLGTGSVIPGWDIGIEGMKLGEQGPMRDRVACLLQIHKARKCVEARQSPSLENFRHRGTMTVQVVQAPFWSPSQ